MRILQINPIAGHSSTGRTTSELDHYFWEHGHEDYVACFSGYDVKEKYIIGNVFDRKMHALLSRITGYEASFSYFPTHQLIKYIKNIKPDIVKLGIAHSNYINIFTLLNFLSHASIPTVIVLNDCWYYTGKCMHYTTNQCYKWKTGCGKCQHLQNGLKTYFFDRTAYLWQKKKKAFENIKKLAIVGVSDWLVNEAKESYLNTALIIRRIYNWVDLNQFYPHNILPKTNIPNRKNKKIILGVASHWNKSKGLDYFLRLSKDIKDDEYIILVGNIPKELVLPKNIFHIQSTFDVEELARIYSIADVFVSFSKEETFGKVIAESLACGTPVVCFDSTALPEIIGNNAGKAVPVGDYFAVKSAIDEILNRKKTSYSSECIQRARQNFSLEKNAQQYLDLFQELINI